MQLRTQPSTAELFQTARALVVGIDPIGEPLTRADMRTIGRSCREGWNVAPEKRRELISRLVATLDCPLAYVGRSAAKTIITIHRAGWLEVGAQ